MTSGRWIVVLASLSAALAACATLLGIEDFVDDAGPTSSGADGGTTTGAGGSATGTGTGTTNGGGGGAAPVSYVCDWSRQLPSSSHAHAAGAAVNADGSSVTIAIAGWFVGQLDLGGSTLVSQYGEQSDGYVAAFDLDGELRWQHDLGENGVQRALAVAVDAPFNVAVVGSFEHDLYLGPSSIITNSEPTGAAQDLFVTLFTSNGALNERFGIGNGAAAQEARAVAIDGSNRVAVGGSFTDDGGGGVDFGGGAVSALSRDGFVAGYDGALDYRWHNIAGGSSNDGVWGLAADEVGQVYAVGSYRSAITWGGVALPVTGEEDVFVAKTNPDGTPSWIATYGDDQTETAHAVAVEGAEIVVVGEFLNQIDFDGDADAGAPHQSNGSADLFVVKLRDEGDEPTYQWSHTFGGSGDDVAYDVNIDRATGDVVVTGVVEGDADFGQGILPGDDRDAFVLVLSPTGETLWAARFGGDLEQEARGVAFDHEGNVVVHGHGQGVLDFGCGPTIDAGAPDAAVTQDLFLVKLRRD
ncbi:MAG: hypothetical protein JRI23_15745 [Deltaproteobacteria bacterium]|jgi:hypothetical protein|nr:hypothetical protein [Deltaproteobacteria bacterium]MBW2533214.1 hypothetical protein [Deltaproteobacteria bacterium]